MATGVAIITKGPIRPARNAPLCPPLSAAQAAEVACAMIADIIDNTRGPSRDQFVAHHADDDNLGRLLDVDVGALRQRGMTFAERIANAQSDLFARGYERALLMSADSPTVEPELVDMALGRLEEVDVVLGPARAGGYTLLATRVPTPRLFAGVRMSTPHVLSETIAQARQSGLRVRLIAPRHDLDRIIDYESAVVRGELHHAPRTVATMERFLQGRAPNTSG